MDMDTAEQAETRAAEDAAHRIRQNLIEHIGSRNLRETAQGIENKYKEKLKDDLRAFGDSVQGGHRIVEFAHPITFGREGDEGHRVVRGVKAERRAPVSLDEDLVRKGLKPHELNKVMTYQVSFDYDMNRAELERLNVALAAQEQPWSVVEVLDEDALLSLAQEDEELGERVKKMYVEGTEVWALKVLDA